MLKQDHRAVEELIKKFERAGDGAAKLKRNLVDRMIAELSRHASIEEQALSPWARECIEDEDDHGALSGAVRRTVSRRGAAGGAGRRASG